MNFESMNYCTRCASYYSRPGSCNCFAPATTTTTTSPKLNDYRWVCAGCGTYPCRGTSTTCARVLFQTGTANEP